MLNFGENCRPLPTTAGTAVTAYKISTCTLFLVQNKSRTFAVKIIFNGKEYGNKKQKVR
jgi:hypothetical protein